MRTAWLITALALAGCASSPEALQRATARSVGGNLDPDSVVVAHIDRGATRVRWTASANGRTYKCSADDMVREPYCTAAR